MPFTFLAHQAPVAPLKLVAPRWFNGTALAIGSMAPDLEYFLKGDVVSRIGHTPRGLLLFCVPLAVALSWLVPALLARPLARHLPDLGPFHLRDYALLARRERSPGRWLLWTVPSAALGALTHVVWDGFTHHDGWVVTRLPALAATLTLPWGRPVAVYKLLQHGGTLLGSAVTLLVLLHIGRRRLLRAWSGAAAPALPPATRASHALLWSPFAGGLLAGLIWAAASSADGPLHLAVRAVLRGTTLGFLGLCLGAALARREPG